MKNLIKFNLKNIFCQKLFYICVIIMIALSPVINVFMGIDTGVKALPQLVSTLSGSVGIIGGLFLAVFSCYDYNEGTLKNIIARGYTRKEVLFSKYICGFIALVVMNLITALLVFIIYSKNGIGSFNTTMFYTLINSLFNLIAFTVFYVTLSCILEKNSSAIIACMFVTTIINAVISFIDAKAGLNISKMWLSNVSSKFTLNPTPTNLGISVFGYSAYALAFGYIGLKVLNKKEIK